MSAPVDAVLRVAARHGLKPNKALGQNFLCDQDVVDQIVAAPGDVASILEIGPGPGILTAGLTERYSKVIALEIDPAMPAILTQMAPGAEVRLADACKVDLVPILEELPGPRAIVSNLPYYVVSTLLQQIAKVEAHFAVAVLMTQKEVAQRIVAPPRSGNRGSLSVYLQALFAIEPLIEVPAASFVPAPKVDSSVLRFVPRRDPDFSDVLIEFVRAGFAQPRKTLAKVLALRFGGRQNVLNALEKIGLGPNARAQELSLAEWAKVREALVAHA